MKIELLYPELGNLYGDTGNYIYLKKCLPDAEFVETHLNDKPAFANEDVSMVVMGSMLESAQTLAVAKLKPYKEELKANIEKGTVFLLTGNSIELLGEYIEEDGEKEEMLGLYPFHSERQHAVRYNYLVRGEFEGMQLVGYKTQFAKLYGTFDKPFMKMLGGMGNNTETETEGIHDHNLFATYYTGPLLPCNPLFVKYLLRLLGHDDHLAYEEEAMAAYENRMQEYLGEAMRYEFHWH